MCGAHYIVDMMNTSFWVVNFQPFKYLILDMS
ncbi:hypothetical protein ROA7450_04139 [Roseovarius albus]|uniref:Uncharacterized protein n=1 Tax=Roseovarius albus TaxID=1247867 RepID=A0A1X7A9F5_9RHOB|nr:hypothetical protein ROA7450_04139 [Roseovarius albus]